MNALSQGAGAAFRCRWHRGLVLAAAMWCGAAALAQVVAVPAAHLNHAEGSVAWSPAGDTEWHDVQPRRVLKRGDRIWVDRGSRAELQAGGQAVRLDGQTQVVLENVSENATQLSLTQGSMALTVTAVNPGDSIEVGTPNLALRARQPGDYRIDVDPKGGTTRVVVLTGDAVVYGETGEALELRNGQRAVFRERSLARVKQAAFAASDDFDRWAAARRRGEPTVTMPAVARSAPPAPPPTGFINQGPDIVIAGPAAGLPGSRLAGKAQAAMPAAHAQAIPNVAVTPSVPAAAPLRVAAPDPQPQPQARTREQVQARARAKAEAREQARAQTEARAHARAQAAREQQERKAAARHADEQRRAVAARQRAAEEERRHAQARRTEDARRQAQARQEQERRQLLARQAEEKRLAALRKQEETRQAAARALEAQKLAEARRRQLARLQEQAGREEQVAREAQARREQQARLRAEEERREDQARHEEQARREEADRRQRQLADQWRRDQERRDQEVWLRQQQAPQPLRPAPMGVPLRRVS
jgi:hypothetical protein